MKWVSFLLLIVFLCSLDSRTTYAVENEKKCSVSSRYVIRSLGIGIGEVIAKMSGTATDNDLRADVDVNVRLLFFKFSLKSTETTCIRDGKVVHYRKTIDTGGNHREITGELDGDMFIIVVRDGEKVERKEFLTTFYQATNMEYPEVALVPGEVRRMRVIDLENSEVVDREYRYVAEEQAVIDNLTVRIIVSDFTDKNSECRRWTAVINGLPVVVRQEGKEKTGLFNPSYKVRQTNATVDPY
jgi:Domain of unknown function (DUF6134)